MSSGNPIQASARHKMRRVLTLGAALILLTVALPGVVRSADAVGVGTDTEVTGYDVGDDPITQPIMATGDFGIDRTAPVVVLFALLLAVAAFGLLVAAVPRRQAKEPRSRQPDVGNASP